jgi:hypothetical protein
MKILETHVFSYDELVNNLELMSYLAKLDSYDYIGNKNRLTIFYLFKTETGIFLKRPEYNSRTQKHYYPKVLVDITKHLGNFKL